MHDQPPHSNLPSPEAQESEVTVPDTSRQSVNDPPQPQFSGLEQRLHRHRSSRRDERKKDRLTARKHSTGRNKRSPGEVINQWIMWGCCFSGMIAILALGYYCGQKFGAHPEAPNRVIQQDAPLPTAETEVLLDTAFSAYQEGKYRVAMMDFQKAQDAQPALFGIDYLIAESAIKAGELALAQEAAGHAVSKNEMAGQARIILAIINLSKSKSSVQEPQQLADPAVSAQNEIRQFMASHPDDAKAFGSFGDMLRMTGEYRSAVEILHKGVLRSNPESARELLSAKEQLARLQNEQARSAPSLSELTAMSAEQALVAALASLQLKQSEEAAVFLERARDLYPPQIFRELMKDTAFDEYHSDPKVRSFFRIDNS